MSFCCFSRNLALIGLLRWEARSADLAALAQPGRLMLGLRCRIDLLPMPRERLGLNVTRRAGRRTGAAALPLAPPPPSPVVRSNFLNL